MIPLTLLISPSEGEGIPRNYSRVEPRNWPSRVGRGVLTAPRPSTASSMPGGGVRTPSPTFRFMESSLFLSDLLTGHEPEMLKLLEINKRIFRFMGRKHANKVGRAPRRALADPRALADSKP